MTRLSWPLALVFVVQLFCAFFFVAEILLAVFGVPLAPIPWLYHELIEIGAAIGLMLGVVIGALFWRAALRRTRIVEAALRAASGAFMDLVNERFDEWGLTPAERDVALFALKGFSLAEIADLRETSPGTVKAQTNAIYRKAGVSGRPQLLSLFVEDLMAEAPVAS
ncbi:LuxR C-terminal-related transcriptional regulator [Gymnodinialimonas sp. 2305UL16-5]|uniref:helix-turn-helix transcriptional regulator n=1 Tax=Gymnodinialimonas mytili TaxID=3126503 RepID=UPI00309B60F9